ncbi:hypothetical protein GIB67_038350 [Kingdonia uniflora]|uniref:Uncharacterized protein n=1 Tax=Kingdonia uniflora TaxID=39325 RepID=A0A7J7KUM6_9MAGN|nr:hypothetical protein GIB67_038350 [Kingdonia uniflora]
MMTTTMTWSCLGSSWPCVVERKAYGSLKWGGRGRRPNNTCISFKINNTEIQNNDNSIQNEKEIQIYNHIERLITETAKQSHGGSGDWEDIQGAWVLQPKNSTPTAIIHFVGGIFVGAAPQLTYRLFLERLSEKGILVIATPYSSGFDHFLIADEVQFKFDRCLRFLQETVGDLPTFGVGHSLGSVIHLLIGSRYAVQRNGNVLMSFNNKVLELYLHIMAPRAFPYTYYHIPFI